MLLGISARNTFSNPLRTFVRNPFRSDGSDGSDEGVESDGSDGSDGSVESDGIVESDGRIMAWSDVYDSTRKEKTTQGQHGTEQTRKRENTTNFMGCHSPWHPMAPTALKYS